MIWERSTDVPKQSSKASDEDNSGQTIDGVSFTAFHAKYDGKDDADDERDGS